ncbi:PE-PPE domain-containing protein [Mycobacterium talmoniae]|uniref:PE family protein PE3 n=1 Tax=Mycobacterium talmoniae TaxID=1858794 RepID=A0A1S1NMK8_9MYCO|nr:MULTISPECIES: PE-PPE domain-containing protein [Mycobacterium]OHV05389.1 hypothetical protein BKN37_06020 [Mycobacterium talmoniae]PQM44330.1 PE family protein PE3 [Mycobacterium talmoniae]TDH56638.1 PE-PPE domain-containing protein [Mycobacterium eburneum]
MTRHRLARLGAALLANVGAAVCMSTLQAAPAAADDATDGLAFIMGGTLNPDPAPSYVSAIDAAYLQSNPLFAGYTPFGLYTPEGVDIPFLSGLTLDQSAAQGELILNNAIMDRPAGSDTLVFGYSQSAVIASLELNALDALPADERPSPEDLSFMLTGDLDNPDGGIFERFAFNIPILGIPFYGATPADTPYPTDIYTGQYDGAADFPQYPLNVVADLNALLGALYVHTQYANLTAAQIQSAVPLATSPGYDGVTHYYMIPTQDLPLVEPLRAIPLVGKLLADLLQPDLTVLVNLGYNPNGYADVPTPAQLLPGFSPLADIEQLAKPLLNSLGVYLPEYPSVPAPDFNPLTIFGQLVTGAYQGVSDALVDLGVLPASDFATTYPAVNTPAAVAALASGLAPAMPSLLSGLDLGSIAAAVGFDPSWFSSVLDLLG